MLLDINSLLPGIPIELHPVVPDSISDITSLTFNDYDQLNVSPSRLSPNSFSSKSSPPAQSKRDSITKDHHMSAIHLRRERNNVAARKYRQKKVDRIKELEDALEEIVKDRDQLRLRLARQEAETAALKSMMTLKSPA
jgi:hypothetical protein